MGPGAASGLWVAGLAQAGEPGASPVLCEPSLPGRAQEANAVRDDVTVEEVMALVAGAFAAIRHAGAEASGERSARIAQLILDGLRPRPT
jgi:hypothetical protein